MLSAVPFYRFILNTLMYAGVTIVGVCLSSSLVAYGFSRIRWRGRDVIFQVMVSNLLIPLFATLIPLFVIYKDLHIVPVHYCWNDFIGPLVYINNQAPRRASSLHSGPSSTSLRSTSC